MFRVGDCVWWCVGGVEANFSDHMSQLMNRMEHMAAKRKRGRGSQGVGSGVPGGQLEDYEDPYERLARKIRNVMDLLRVSLLNPKVAGGVVTD
jgi:hypothetical protein